MSQFIKKLKRVSQAPSQPMGFRAIHPNSEKPRILLIASLAQAGSLADQVVDADAGLLRISTLSSGTKALEKVSQAVPGTPWGGWLEGIAEKEVEPIAKAGFDFVVFPPASTSLAILKSDKVGKILQIGASTKEGLLPAVNELPIDAVLIADQPEKDYFLTWQHLIFFQRCADLVTKPLLASVPYSVSPNELQVLWETGISGVVVSLGDGQPAGRLKELRQAVDKLVFTAPRKLQKAKPLLPYNPQTTYEATEEEEE